MPDLPLRRVVIEVHSATFEDRSAAGIRQTCETILRRWEPVCALADALALELDADLSGWRGDLDAPLAPADPHGALTFRQVRAIGATWARLVATRGREVALRGVVAGGPGWDPAAARTAWGTLGFVPVEAAPAPVSDLPAAVAARLLALATAPCDGDVARLDLRHWAAVDQREAADLVVPLAGSRVLPDGSVAATDSLAVPGDDATLGRLAGELAGLVGAALRSGPDEPGPLVWLLHDPAEAAFLARAVAQGLPVSSVMTAADFAVADLDALLTRVLVTAVPPAGATTAEVLVACLEAGGRVLCHGPAADGDPALLERLGLAPDETVQPGAVALAVTDTGRALATRRGPAVWVRDDPASLADLLPGLGWTVAQEVRDGGQRALVLPQWSDNALWYVGAKPDAATRLRLATPDGVPVVTGLQTLVEDGAGSYTFDRSFRRECRAFVRQEHGWVRCDELPAPSGMSRRLRLEGLQEAVVTLRPPLDALEDADLEGADAAIFDEDRGGIVAFGVTGALTVTW